MDANCAQRNISSIKQTFCYKRKSTTEHKVDTVFSDDSFRKCITVEIASNAFNNTKTNAIPYPTRKTSFGTCVDNFPTKLKSFPGAVVKPTSNSNMFIYPISENSFVSSKANMAKQNNDLRGGDYWNSAKTLSPTQLSHKAKLQEQAFSSSSIISHEIPCLNNRQHAQTSENLHQRTINFSKLAKLSLEKSSSKAGGITGATMRTIGGKVVLNIHKVVKSPRKMFKVVPSEIRKEFSPSNMENGMHEYTCDPSNFSNCKDIKTPEQTSTLRDLDIRLHAGARKTNGFSACLPNLSLDCNLPSKSSTILLESSKTQVSSTPPSNRVLLDQQNRAGTQNCVTSPSRWKLNSQCSSQREMVQSTANIGTTLPKLTRSATWPMERGENLATSLEHDRNYTVVKDVKKFHDTLEDGETQQFEDEISYLLEGLKPSQPLDVRCLSAVDLANKCQKHNFRLCIRAHGISDEIFNHLVDARSYQDLALSTAALLFMLSRDRQMEINKSTLHLLLRLVDPFNKEVFSSSQLKTSKNDVPTVNCRKRKFFKSKTRGSPPSMKTFSSEAVHKVKKLVDSCGDPLLSGDDVSVKRLSTEALLRFTVRRPEEWFLEEVRVKGGLDYIISLIVSHVETSEALFKKQHKADNHFEAKDALSSLERILKVLENAIVDSPKNATYLVTHQRAVLLRKLARLMTLCKSWLAQHCNLALIKLSDSVPSITNPYTMLHYTLLQVIKLLVNISNDNEWVSTRIGEQDGLLGSIVDCVVLPPPQLQESHKYEFILLSLSLLVNLVESSAKNRLELLKMKIGNEAVGCGDCNNTEVPVVQCLVKLFVEREKAARDNEVLGEEGVKKAAKAKKEIASNLCEVSGPQPSSGMRAVEYDGHWEETEDGMEWVPADVSDDKITNSQSSCTSNVSLSKNPESNLTAAEKTEMKETLDKANEHMENSIVASYAALVLGCLVHGERANSFVIRSCLGKEADFTPMIKMLKKFLSFMSLTAGITGKGEKTLTQIIEVLEEENLTFNSGFRPIESKQTS